MDRAVIVRALAVAWRVDEGTMEEWLAAHMSRGQWLRLRRFLDALPPTTAWVAVADRYPAPGERVKIAWETDGREYPLNVRWDAGMICWMMPDLTALIPVALDPPPTHWLSIPKKEPA